MNLRFLNALLYAAAPWYLSVHSRKLALLFGKAVCPSKLVTGMHIHNTYVFGAVIVSTDGQVRPETAARTEIEDSMFRFAAFDSKPVVQGAIKGTCYAAVGLLGCGLISLMLILFDILIGVPAGGGGLALMIPFGIGPIVLLAGAPWSFIAMKMHSPLFILTVIVGGALLNGAFIGAMWRICKSLLRGK
ncbi:hypothetical protein GTP46_18765 [Duganella sp. FT135W]|uniref:Uncharacterized protein n=1 Tax=Duganella flavida TaxID=2692175 RepID=A0A6L8KFV4_9BURK|nr:hypothetical protein [Duganella flavida]MYM24682.1 hypothetical protein [Duganella flavida]